MVAKYALRPFLRLGTRVGRLSTHSNHLAPVYHILRLFMSGAIPPMYYSKSEPTRTGPRLTQHRCELRDNF